MVCREITPTTYLASFIPNDVVLNSVTWISAVNHGNLQKTSILSCTKTDVQIAFWSIFSCPSVTHIFVMFQYLQSPTSMLPIVESCPGKPCNVFSYVRWHCIYATVNQLMSTLSVWQSCYSEWLFIIDRKWVTVLVREGWLAQLH